MANQIAIAGTLAGVCEAIAYARCCGCRILATMHGDSLEELDRKQMLP